jgi:hypothetical protein
MRTRPNHGRLGRSPSKGIDVRPNLIGEQTRAVAATIDRYNPSCYLTAYRILVK